MEKIILSVEGMSCPHCVKVVNNAVGQLNGIFSVDVNLEAKTVTVGYDAQKVSVEGIKLAILEEGYVVNE